jgi:hypothetical protein
MLHIKQRESKSSTIFAFISRSSAKLSMMEAVTMATTTHEMMKLRASAKPHVSSRKGRTQRQ